MIDNTEKDKLGGIADILDHYFYRVYKLDHEYGFILHWSADEIRKIIKEEEV